MTSTELPLDIPFAMPNLKWIKRGGGRRVPTWVSPDKRYEPRTVALQSLWPNEAAIRDKCVALNAELGKWQAGLRGHVGGYDATIGYVLRRYEKDDDSPFHALRPGSKHPYEFYLKRLAFEIGDRRIENVTGVDLKRWHEAWSEGGTKLAASKMMRAVLDAAVSYAIMSFKSGTPERRAVSELREALKTAGRKLPAPRRRESTVTAADVVRLRQAAHEAGRPSMALAYALVFETTLRLWDVIGQWWPTDAPLISDVVTAPYRSRKHAMKWFGLRWEDIGPDLVMRYVPSKTSAKTGLAVTFPLAMAPMVVEELAAGRGTSGPVIVSETTGQPYSGNMFGEHWRKDREKAGIPANVWARDLRASGVSEGRAAAVATDDVAKVAGHASTKTTSAIYDRAALEAAERFAEARAKRRAK